MSHPLFTIGYAGHTPESFVTALRGAGVATLVDIRRRAASRKRGFAKSALAESLAAAGIGYVHLRELGVPEELRAELRAGTRELAGYLTELGRYLEESEEGRRGLAQLRELMVARRCCVMCVEADAAECHRSVVGRATRERGMEVVELGAP